MKIAKLKSWAWKIFTVPIIWLMYCVLISEALRYLLPVLATRIHKLPLPFVSYLRYWEGFHRLDIAHLFAILLCMAVWFLWVEILTAFLSNERSVERSGWNPDAYRCFVNLLGGVVLSCDAILFYIAVTQLDWGSSRFSFAALVATAIYLGVIVFVSFVSVKLDRPLKEV